MQTADIIALMKELYLVSIVALYSSGDDWKFDHDAYAIFASAPEFAEQAALKLAYEQWPTESGYINHHAKSVKMNRESAMKIPEDLMQANADNDKPKFIM